MKKLILSVVAAVALATPALAADLRVKARRRRRLRRIRGMSPSAPAITSDYIFRGITQSNHKPSVNAYFEPRYNVTPYLQLYAGVAGSSISFPNRAAAEIDGFAGIRPTFGPLALDFGGIVLLVSGRELLQRQRQPGIRHRLPRERLPAGQRQRHQEGPELLGGVRQGHLHGERSGRVRRRRSPTRRRCSIRAPRAPTRPAVRSSRRRAPRCLRAGDCTCPAKPATGSSAPATPSTRVAGFPNGIPYKSYTTWNVGIGITKSVFTLDFRYYDTDLNKGDCNAFTSDRHARFTNAVTPINPGGFGSNWCGSSFVVAGKFDLTAMANLK